MWKWSTIGTYIVEIGDCLADTFFHELLEGLDGLCLTGICHTLDPDVDIPRVVMIALIFRLEERNAAVVDDLIGEMEESLIIDGEEFFGPSDVCKPCLQRCFRLLDGNQVFSKRRR